MNYLMGIFRFFAILLMIPVILVVTGLRLPRLSEDAYRAEVALWCRRLLAAMGVAVSHSGRPVRHAAPGEEGILLLSNHVSFIDIFAIDTLLCSRFVAKAEIGNWPVFGSIAKSVRTIFIDRANRRSIIAIAEKMESVLKGGENVIFFPEGTTGPGDRLLPLHANLIEAAVATGATVQPVVLKYTSRGERTTRLAYTDISIFRCLWNVVTTPRAAIEVEVLSPIEPRGRNRHEICREVSAMMARALGVEDPLAGTAAPRRLGCQPGAPAGVSSGPVRTKEGSAR